MAWGLKQLLNRIPYEDAVSIRIQMVGHYGKTGYYRFYRGERGLMPKDQADIKQLCRNKGIKEEPTDQRYTCLLYTSTFLEKTKAVQKKSSARLHYCYSLILLSQSLTHFSTSA